MDVTTLLPTPRKVLRTVRWGFDVLLWAEDATRRVVCELTSPFTGHALLRGSFGPAAPTSPVAGAPTPTPAEPTARRAEPVARPRSVATYGPPAAEFTEVAPEAPAAGPRPPARPAARREVATETAALSGAVLLAEGVLPEGVLSAPVAGTAASAEARAGDSPADDLTRINGVGPRIAERLAHSGVTAFAQLAAWNADDIARFEAQLPGVQKGKVERDGWVAQARELARSDGPAFVAGAGADADPGAPAERR